MAFNGHESPAVMHLQQEVQPFFDLQSHLLSSLHALVASGSVIQTGFHALSCFVQPHPACSYAGHLLQLATSHLYSLIFFCMV